MERPSDEITRLAEQCKPDRSFPPGMSKRDAVLIIRYIEWIEDYVDMKEQEMNQLFDCMSPMLQYAEYGMDVLCGAPLNPKKAPPETGWEIRKKRPKISSCLESPSTVPDTAQADASGEA